MEVEGFYEFISETTKCQFPCFFFLPRMKEHEIGKTLPSSLWTGFYDVFSNNIVQAKWVFTKARILPISHDIQENTIGKVYLMFLTRMKEQEKWRTHLWSFVAEGFMMFWELMNVRRKEGFEEWRKWRIIRVKDVKVFDDVFNDNESNGKWWFLRVHKWSSQFSIPTFLTRMNEHTIWRTHHSIL